jgi:iron complex outermembrane receptor protein
MKKHVFLMMMAAAAIVFAGNVAFAQERITVNGTVTDETGEPLAGVVITAASRQSVSTDANGRFTFLIPQGENLTFSYLGYASQTLPAQPVLTVQLNPSAVQLGDVTVVAVGYGTARRADLTGAITSVSAKDFKQGIISSTEQLLQGKVAGLTVIKNGGNPTESAAMRLRGGTSLSASNAPLVVIDGIPGVNINTVQPNEILSIDVLKDASAAAIYGSRGANGVIMITTNREQKGRSMEYNGYVAVGFAKNLDILSADEWRDYYRTHNPDALSSHDYGASTDWQKELEQTAVTHSHTLSFAQGGEHNGMRASASYLDNQGIMKNSRLERFNASLTGHQYGFNKRLRLEASLHTTVDKTDDVDAGLLRTAYRINPTIPVYQPDGTFTKNPDILGTNASNVVESHTMRYDEGTRKRLFAYGKAELEIIDGLKAQANMSYEYQSAQDYYYEPAGKGYPPSTNNSASRKLDDYTRKQIETYLTYDKVFAEKHRVNLMVGYSYMDYMTEGFGAQRSKFDTDFFMWNNLGAGTDFKAGDVSSYKRSAQLASVFARANYSFNSRYMLTATIRRDGSSRFGENNKWGTFPSVSAAWRVSEEAFMESAKGWLDDLKLRAGYGVTGNQEGIEEYTSLPTLGSGKQYYDVASGTWKNSYGYTRNANPDLKWESTAQTDIGVDFVLFNKLNVSFDWYYKKTSDLLYTYQVPTPPFLFSTLLANVGDLSNRGVELTLGANIVRTNDFTFDASLTLAHNKQTVDKLSNDLYQTGNIYRGSLQGMQGLDVRTQVIAEGYPVGTFIGLRSGGIVDGQFDVPRDSNGKPLTTFQDEEVYVVLGDAQPDLTFGLALNLTYKQFDLGVAAYGMLGQKVLNGISAELSGKSWSYAGRYNFTKKFAESGLTEEPNPAWCDYWLENASYLRLQSVTLGYTIPKNTLTRKLGIERLRFYVTGENLLTLTGYTGLDPEVSIEGLDQPGIDKGNIYPMPRTISFGINFSF